MGNRVPSETRRPDSHPPGALAVPVVPSRAFDGVFPRCHGDPLRRTLAYARASGVVRTRRARPLRINAAGSRLGFTPYNAFLNHT